MLIVERFNNQGQVFVGNLYGHATILLPDFPQFISGNAHVNFLPTHRAQAQDRTDPGFWPLPERIEEEREAFSNGFMG